MPWWAKSALVATVLGAHLGVLSFFERAARPNIAAGRVSEAPMHIALVPVAASQLPTPANLPGAGPSPHSLPKPAPLEKIPAAVDLPAATPQTPASKPEIFLAPEDVDQTATPLDHFEESLAQSLAFARQDLDIEFWIDSNGRTVQVLCLGENCTDSLRLDLQLMMGLVFKPAEKAGQAVASRKLIHIDAPPSYGL